VRLAGVRGLGVGLEQALRDDIPATMATLRAFNRWLDDDWGFSYQDRILAVPMLSLADPDAALVELEWLLERGARASDWVLVHDAARCLLQPVWVDRLIDACLDDDVGGLLALPLADTLKQAQGERAVQTIDRTGKWLAQTPQMFRYRLLLQALRAADAAAATDEARAIERLGLRPKLVLGDTRNIKVTFPEDLALAELIIGSGRQSVLGRPRIAKGSNRKKATDAGRKRRGTARGRRSGRR